jgi:flagellar FliL protein
MAGLSALESIKSLAPDLVVEPATRVQPPEPVPVLEAKTEGAISVSYLPLNNMVVNLADAESVAQIGVTLEVNSELVDEVKAYLPVLRSIILTIISSKSAGDLLSPIGKEKLANQILYEANAPFGGTNGIATPGTGTIKQPVVSVLYSSFSIQ